MDRKSSPHPSLRKWNELEWDCGCIMYIYHPLHAINTQWRWIINCDMRYLYFVYYGLLTFSPKWTKTSNCLQWNQNVNKLWNSRIRFPCTSYYLCIYLLLSFTLRIILLEISWTFTLVELSIGTIGVLVHHCWRNASYLLVIIIFHNYLFCSFVAWFCRNFN